MSDLKTWDAFASVSLQQQQAHVSGEIAAWDTIMEQELPTNNETRLTRRVALATLAALSASLLARVQRGLLTPRLAEEFLAQCATSLTACYQLMKGEGLATVEHALARYLPALLAFAKTPSPWQQRAATLAAQGSFLMGQLKLHRLQFAQYIAYLKECVTCARIAQDQTLFIAALTHLGAAWKNTGQPENMLQCYQEAASFLQTDTHLIPLPLQSRIHLGLAWAYARLSHPSEAQTHLHAGNESFFARAENNLPSDPMLSSDFDLPLKILWEGFVSVGLGDLEAQMISPSQRPYESATTALAQIDQLAPSTPISERIRVEIINQRGLVAVKAGEMDSFKTYLLTGVEGARTLGSEKRRQEALTNWKEARARWPHEQGISELGELFF